VNYKKVMLHLQQSFEEAESDLAVFGAILFSVDGSVDGSDGSVACSSIDDKANRRRQVKLSQELDTLRGMLHVIRSVRSSTSVICKTIRFPPPNASTTARMFIASGVWLTTASLDVAIVTSRRLSDATIHRVAPDMDAEGGLCHRLRDVQGRLRSMEEQVRAITASSGWPPSHLLPNRKGGEGSEASLSSCCRECKESFGSKWLRGGCCWRCRTVLRDSGRCSSGNAPHCIVCPHLRACFACDGISCSACGVIRSVAVESDGSLCDWLLELDPQPQALYLDFDATLCNTSSGGAPQTGKHALHVELAAIVESGAFRIVVVTKQNPQHHQQIVTFLEGFGWVEGRDYVLHCIGGTGVTKSSVIEADISQQRQQPDASYDAVFIDDSIKEILQARSQLPPSVTTLVFAAPKSSYVRSSRRDAPAQTVSMQSPSAVVAAQAHVSENGASVYSDAARAAAAKLEHVLGVKVDLSQPADSGVHVTSVRASSLSLSSTAAAAPANVKDGPGWSTSLNSCASATASAVPEPSACDGNIVFKILQSFIASHLALFAAYNGFETSTTLEQLRRLQEQWVVERNWTQFHTPRNLVLALVGEVGELAELFQWRGEVACRLPGWTDRRESPCSTIYLDVCADSMFAEREHLGEELSDVFLYLIRLADVCAVDLVSCIKSKIQKNSTKYPCKLLL